MGASFDENQSSVSFLLGEQNTAEVSGKDRVHLRAEKSSRAAVAKRFEHSSSRGEILVCKINVRNEKDRQGGRENERFLCSLRAASAFPEEKCFSRRMQMQHIKEGTEIFIIREVNLQSSFFFVCFIDDYYNIFLRVKRRRRK